MDYSIGEMQFEELDLNAIEQKIKEEKALEEEYVETPRESARFPTNPPFSHLEKLDLSYNQVTVIAKIWTFIFLTLIKYIIQNLIR